MQDFRHLIIGCGSAAISAAKEIRRIRHEDEVKLVTMENYPPYSPMSLPYLVSERVHKSDIQMVSDDYFDQIKAILIKGRKVVGVNLQDNKVTYDNGDTDIYDKLLIASGSEPIIPPLFKKAGCLQFHTMEDYLDIVRQLQDNTQVTVLGAGLVGMELAAALREKGHEVRLIDKEKRILMRYFDEEGGRRIAGLFRENGILIDLDWGDSIAAERHSRGTHVDFASGHSFDTQMLIVCIGVTPRTSFLLGDEIKINQGIIVDKRMQTNVSNVFAAGDVAEAPDFFTGKKGLNPILPCAVQQGKLAGRNMAGQEDDYEGWLPMNTFNFFGHKAISVGDFTPLEGDEILIEKEDGKRLYTKLLLRDDRIVGANFLNANVDAGVIQYLIRQRVRVDKHKDLLRKKIREVTLSLMLDAEKRQTRSFEN